MGLTQTKPVQSVTQKEAQKKGGRRPPVATVLASENKTATSTSLQDRSIIVLGETVRKKRSSRCEVKAQKKDALTA